jgi:aminopeptidase N
VNEAGRPTVTTDVRIENGRIAGLAFVQEDPAPRRGLVWTQRLDVALGYDDEVRRIPVTLDAPRIEVTAARGLPAPRFVLPTGGGIGYGGFAIDAATRDYLLGRLADISDPLTRGSATVTLWEDMLDGRSPAADVVEVLLIALPREQDELNLQRMLSYTEQGYWKFLPPAARDRLAPRLERILRHGVDAAGTASIKSAWFSALRDVAQTPATLDWLERVWQQIERVPGLVLEEPDYIQLAQQLALRGRSNWQQVLDAQFSRIQNPDRKARFAFVRPSLSPVGAVRDAFFESLRSLQNRRREPWVLEALSHLHHPLRAAASAQYIPSSLAMLDEIQRTGDIFFPKRWMDATLSGHRSASAALMVRTFLAGLPPSYPDRLRRTILSSADELFRAAGGPSTP